MGSSRGSLSGTGRQDPLAQRSWEGDGRSLRSQDTPPDRPTCVTLEEEGTRAPLAEGEVAVSILVSTLLAFSPPPPSDEPIEAPPVRIRGDQRRDPTAASSVVPRADLAEEPVQDLPAVLDELPSVRISRLGGLGSYATASIRGSTADQVLVTLDGIPLNSADGGPVDLSLLPLGPLERVEVYRGMAPLDLGASAIGGAVSLISRSPRSPILELEGGGGSFGTRLARTFVGTGAGRTSVALGLDYLGSESDFEFEDDRGTLLGAGEDDRTATRENADFDRVSALLRATTRVGGVDVRATNLLAWREQGLPGVGLFSTEAARLETLRNLTGLSVSMRDLGDVSGRFTLAPYATVTRVALNDPRGEIGLATPDATRDRLWSVGVRTLGGLRISLDEEDTIALTPSLLAEFRHEVFTPSDQGQAGVPSSRELGIVGGELAATWEAAGLEIVAGGRAELLGSDLEARTTEPGEARIRRDTFVADASWRAAAVWRPIAELSLRLSASQSLRPPSEGIRAGRGASPRRRPAHRQPLRQRPLHGSNRRGAAPSGSSGEGTERPALPPRRRL